MARENDFEVSDYVNSDGTLKFDPNANVKKVDTSERMCDNKDMSETMNTEGAVWGTTKTHQLTVGDVVLVGIYTGTSDGKAFVRNQLPAKSYLAKSVLIWKTVAAVECSPQRTWMGFTDGTEASGGVATRYYARKGTPDD